jgi:hypothetical protein
VRYKVRILAFSAVKTAVFVMLGMDMLHMDDKKVHLKAPKTKLLNKWPLGRPSERRYTKEQMHT